MRDKVRKAFVALRKRGFFARMNFWCCQTCGWAAVPEGRDNVVFYHAQDKETMNKHGVLWLAWSGDGAAIVQELIGQGLLVAWNGSDGRRILVAESLAVLERFRQ